MGLVPAQFASKVQSLPAVHLEFVPVLLTETLEHTQGGFAVERVSFQDDAGRFDNTPGGHDAGLPGDNLNPLETRSEPDRVSFRARGRGVVGIEVRLNPDIPFVSGQGDPVLGREYSATPCSSRTR